MSEERAPHTHSLTHAETQTQTMASSTHTGGPVQLQAPSDTEEKKVSTQMLDTHEDTGPGWSNSHQALNRASKLGTIQK